MTVWNEFFGGFQQNMRNDYVERNLKEKDITMHGPEDALLSTGAAALHRHRWKETNRNDARTSL